MREYSAQLETTAQPLDVADERPHAWVRLMLEVGDGPLRDGHPLGELNLREIEFATELREGDACWARDSYG